MNNATLLFCFFFIGLSIISQSCGSKSSSNEGASGELSYEARIKIKQYVSEGRKLYSLHCANCHQVNGEGLASLYPPVKNSDFLMKDMDKSICYVKNGLKGEINVNGIVFNQEMPANNTLTDLELAEILTFVVNEFNEREKLISQKDVRRVLKDCQP